MEKPSKIIIADKHGTYKGFDYLVLNTRNMYYCAYVRIPESHPFYKIPYLSIDLNCHGGLTFGEMTPFDNVRVMEWDSRFYGFFWQGRWNEERVRKGYWLGWDYGHDGDFDPTEPEKGGEQKTADEIVLEIKLVIEELIKKEK